MSLFFYNYRYIKCKPSQICKRRDLYYVINQVKVRFTKNIQQQSVEIKYENWDGYKLQ